MGKALLWISQELLAALKSWLVWDVPQASPHSCLGHQEATRAGPRSCDQRQHSHRGKGCFETELIKPSLTSSLLVEWLLGWEMFPLCLPGPAEQSPAALWLFLPPHKHLPSLTTTISEHGTGTLLLVFSLGPFQREILHLSEPLCPEMCPSSAGNGAFPYGRLLKTHVGFGGSCKIPSLNAIFG